jgi:hypothetical protein
MDKQEIVTQAIALDSYDISIIPIKTVAPCRADASVVRADSEVLAQIEANLTCGPDPARYRRGSGA